MVEFRIDGRVVPPGQAGKIMADKVLKAVHQKLRERVEALRCSEHGTSPTLQSKTKSGANQTEFQFSCCCDGLRQRVAEVFKS